MLLCGIATCGVLLFPHMPVGNKENTDCQNVKPIFHFPLTQRISQNKQNSFSFTMINRTLPEIEMLAKYDIVNYTVSDSLLIRYGESNIF